MTDDQILQKAIRRAIQGGWKPDYMDGKNHPFCVIFNHDFAKAFWGERMVRDGYTSLSFGQYTPIWRLRLQEMVLEEEPLWYLEIFLTEPAYENETK